MEKPIEYSSRIDIESYKNLRFVLTALDRQEKDIVISADYGPSHDEPGMIVADVWAGFAYGSLRSFLYTAHIEKCALEDYVGIAMEIHEQPRVSEQIKRFYSMGIPRPQLMGRQLLSLRDTLSRSDKSRGNGTKPLPRQVIALQRRPAF